jgi:hypothetical protein
VRIIVSPTKIPFSTGTYRAISTVLTVPVGKEYRPWEEKIPYRWGRNTVLQGKFYRTGGEGIPFSKESFTVPVGKEYRTSREIHLRFFLQIESNFKRVGVALVCVSALMFLFLFGKRGR